MSDDPSNRTKCPRQSLLSFMVAYFARVFLGAAWIITVLLLLRHSERDASLLGICILLAGATIALAIRSRR